MKITRKTEIETTEVQVGDQIQVGKYTATCQAIPGQGLALFLLDQYLDKGMAYNSKNTNRGGYAGSDVRRDLNSPDVLKIFEGMPLVPHENGDLLRLPFYGEMFGHDYSLYSDLTEETAYGFLTRGCPNGCPFCIVSKKEGRKSEKVADLREWWSGQKNIVLCDPNILACREHMDLLEQLAASGAWVDINQGLDARLLTRENIEVLKAIKIKEVHFAWDLMKNSKRIIAGLNLWKRYGKKNRHGKWGTVYVLVNFNTTMAENLYRIYKLRDMGFDPYVMIYSKPTAPQEIRYLQRWCNNKVIFRACPDFKDYNPKKE